MLSVINYLLGNVHVEVTGAYPERFLNLCAQNGIGFWDMSREAPDIIQIRVAAADYHSLKKYAKKAMCHLHIIQKTGLPFFTNRFKKRTALIAGLFVFCIVAWILTSFVWIIDIEGYDKVSPVLIREHLKNNGVYIGAPTRSIHVTDISNDIILNMPELKFVTINLNGSHAKVTVRERTKPPEILSMDHASNLVASRGGIITSVVVTSGMPEVKIGETVAEGQLLASGYMTGRSGTTIATRAVGKIRARTWRHITAKFPLKTLIKSYTGNTKSRKSLILGDRRIKLFFNSGIPYEECDKIVKNVRLTLPWNISLPIALETQVFNQYVTQDFNIPPDTAYEYISDRMEQYIHLQKDDTLKNKRFEGSVKNGAATVVMTAELEEDIGLEQIIPKGE